jgi:hypothetical protein
MMKDAAIRALAESIRACSDDKIINRIVERFHLTETDKKEAAESVYNLMRWGERGEELGAARLAKRFNLDPHLKTAAAEKFYNKYYKGKDYYAAAKIAKEFDLPAAKLDDAVENALVQSMLKSDDQPRNVYAPETSKIVEMFEVKPEKVFEKAGVVFDIYQEKGDFVYAAYLAKEQGLDEAKQKSAAEMAYAYMSDRHHNYGDLKRPAMLARDFNLGQEKLNNAVRSLLIEQISYKRYDKVAETVEEFGVSEPDFKVIVLSAYRHILRRSSIAAKEIVDYYKLEITPEEMAKLAGSCYQELIDANSSKAEQYVQAAELARVYGLGDEKVKDALKNAIWSKEREEDFVGAARLANKAVQYLTAMSYDAAELSKLKDSADRAVDTAFKLYLGARKYNISSADEVAAEFSMDLERQKRMANEVFDEATIGPSPQLPYNCLLEIATRYGLYAGKVELALNGVYDELLTYNYGHATKIAEDNSMPLETRVTIENRQLLNMLRQGYDEKAIKLIRNIAGVVDRY